MSGLTPSPLVLIALGSNLGDPQANVLAAFDQLERLSTRPILRSSLWFSEPVDCPPGSPPFINAAAALFPQSGETPESLLSKLQILERDFGRQPKQVLNEARPLDADLIAWGEETRQTTFLTLPHPRAHLRAFVVCPLTELAPEFILPGQKQNLAALATRLADQALRKL